jgi:hypothetical protein
MQITVQLRWAVSIGSIEKRKDEKTLNCNSTRGFVLEYNLVSHIKGRTYVGDVYAQGAEENGWA